MTSPAVAPDISSCHQAAILTAASRLVAGLSPRAPELSSRPVHARLLWTARHRNRFFSELHFHLVSVTPLLLHAHSSVPPHAAQPNNMCERRSVLRDAGWRFEVFWSVCVCVCVYTHTHTHFCQEVCHTCIYALHQYGPVLYFQICHTCIYALHQYGPVLYFHN